VTWPSCEKHACTHACRMINFDKSCTKVEGDSWPRMHLVRWHDTQADHCNGVCEGVWWMMVDDGGWCCSMGPQCMQIFSSMFIFLSSWMCLLPWVTCTCTSNLGNMQLVQFTQNSVPQDHEFPSHLHICSTEIRHFNKFFSTRVVASG